jgi:hypothetical protein
VADGINAQGLPSSNAIIMVASMPAPDQMTLRGIGPRLRAALQREAVRRGQSQNRAALALLAEALGVAAAGPAEEHDDLDELAGTWSKSEAARFDEALRAQRQVDAKLWR